MTAYLPFPDIEAVVGQALRDAGVCSGRVYSSLPKTPTFPLALVRRVGGVPVVRQKLDRARIQIDVWGTKKSEARDAAEAARIAAHELEGTTSTRWAAYVTAVDDEVGLTYLPDSDTGRDRYTFALAVYAYHQDPPAS